MKIAILGTRGIPARYGGFETLAEQLATRLAARGHAVTVYCRKPFTRPDDVVHPGVKRVILPTISRKHFDTFFNTLLSVFHVGFTDADVVLICNVGNSSLAWIPRIFGKPTILNVDGLDRKRKKWNWFARAFLLMCERMAVYTPTRIVTDASAIRDYYRLRYHKESTLITYGAEVPAGCEDMNGFDLPRYHYVLYVTRLEPENNPELVISAYNGLQTDWLLVLVGDSKYDPAYAERLKAMAGPNVRFLGSVYGDGYWTLQKNAGIYVSALEIGGVHPTLVEAMAAGNPLAYLDTPENREAVGDGGLSFPHDPAELASTLKKLIDDPTLREKLEAHALARASERYSWDKIVTQYEQLFAQLSPPL